MKRGRTLSNPWFFRKKARHILNSSLERPFLPADRSCSYYQKIGSPSHAAGAEFRGQLIYLAPKVVLWFVVNVSMNSCRSCSHSPGPGQVNVTLAPYTSPPCPT